MIIFGPEKIIAYCGKSSYDKGQSCTSFAKAFVQDTALFGLYEGSVGLYHINLVFENNTPEYVWCTCPAMGQYDDTCKHVAGLLILWNKSPKKFTVLDSWQSLLRDKGAEELLKLIRTTAHQSIYATSALYEQLKGEPLITDDEMYDPEDEW